jgi:hypothetical protein
MAFAGRGMRMIDIEWWQNMEMNCARGGGNRKDRTRNGNCRTQNDSSRDYNLLPESLQLIMQLITYIHCGTKITGSLAVHA